MTKHAWAWAIFVGALGFVSCGGSVSGLGPDASTESGGTSSGGGTGQGTGSSGNQGGGSSSGGSDGDDGNAGFDATLGTADAGSGGDGGADADNGGDSGAEDGSADAAEAAPVCPTDAMSSPGSPPSCAPGGAGMTNCGSSCESCCTSLEVQGGTFYRTYDGNGTGLDGGPGIVLAEDGGPTGEADPATVSSFRLDKYLVTVGRFRQFVAAWNNGKGWLPPAGAGKHAHLNGGKGLLDVAAPADAGTVYESGWDPAWDAPSFLSPTDADLVSCVYHTWTTTPTTQENLPIACVSWYDAAAFCAWDGGFLPSNAEWEYAAAGGGGPTGQREYPWGSADPGTASQYAIYKCYFNTEVITPPFRGTGVCSANDITENIAPVGSAPLGAGAWGQLDLAGDVDEWTADYFLPYVSPCSDCAALTTPPPNDEYITDCRDLRGGGFIDHAPALVPSGRHCGSAWTTGFRCARTP